MNIEQLNEAISLFQAKIESQGMVVNERDAEHLKHLIEVRAKAYGYKRYARQCSVTGEGMNDGYVFNDNEYIKHKKDLIKLLRSKDWTAEDEEGNDIPLSLLDDDGLLEWAYNDEIYYWTEWECPEDYEYEEINGILTEI